MRLVKKNYDFDPIYLFGQNDVIVRILINNQNFFFSVLGGCIRENTCQIAGDLVKNWGSYGFLTVFG